MAVRLASSPRFENEDFATAGAEAPPSQVWECPL